MGDRYPWVLMYTEICHGLPGRFSLGPFYEMAKLDEPGWVGPI
jgi:hypothetical protein